MRTVVCVILGTLAAGWAVAGASAPEPQQRAGEPARPYGIGTPPGLAQVPAQSCSAAACHGGGQAGRVGSEYTSWAPEAFAAGPHDPHARAYRVLFNDSSTRMAKALNRGPAHKDALCLKCHAVDGMKGASAVADGVGCGACHGPAERWLAVHYLPDWKALSNRQKWDDYGFVPTKDLVARELNCAGCHVGSADREVNHDLIAAGHPRLAFEYTRFHYRPNYRKHWEERVPQPDFEIRAWAVGQVASLRAALAVLRSRAVRAARNDADTPWPELSEGSCFACHQGIARNPFPESRQEPPRGLQGLRGGHGRPPGTVPWQPWYSSLGTAAAEYHGILFHGLPGLTPVNLTPLRAEMEKRAPNPVEVARTAGQAIDELDGWLAKWQSSESGGTPARLTPERSQELARLIVRGAVTDDGRLKDYDWDFVAQRYLGLSAVYHANGGAGTVAEWRDPLVTLRQALAFPRANSVRFNSPKDYRPADAAGPLKSLRTITTSRSGR